MPREFMQTRVIAIHQGDTQEDQPLSKAQKKFNSLSKKIEGQKKRLQDWQAILPTYDRRLHQDYLPLVARYKQCCVDVVHLLDAAHGDSFFKKTDKAKLSALIVELSRELIHEGYDELKEIYNRYSTLDFESEKRQVDAALSQTMKTLFEEMYDMDFDDNVDFSSPEAIHEAVEAKLHAEQARQAHKARTRKKTAKQREKEAQQKEEAQHVSKSIQTVFRQLVAALHPDREPDEAERERKTQLMQQINEAYRKRDLLALLALQLDIAQIDQRQLNTLAEEQLTHFSQILKEQLVELETEINEIEYPFRAQFGLSPYVKLTPQRVLKALSFDIGEIQSALAAKQKELNALQDPVLLKSMLKSYRL